MSSRVLALVLALTVAFVGVESLAASPATAKSMSNQYGTLVAPDRIARGITCVTEVVEFRPASNVHNWELAVDITTPSADGRPTFLLTEAAPSHMFKLCSRRDGPGFYGITGYLQASSSDTPGTCCDISAGFDGGINFRVINRVRSALSVKVARSHSKRCPLGLTKHCSLVRGTLTRAGKPMSDWFQLQVRRHGRWVRQGWCHAGSRGRCGWYVVITAKERRTKFRLYFPRHDYARASASRVFTLPY